MKRKIKLILKILIAIIAFFILKNISSIYKDISVNFIKLPSEFESYTSLNKIDSLLQSTNLNIRTFSSSRTYPKIAREINDSTLFFKVHKKHDLYPKGIFFWYKIDKKGDVIDSLSINNEFTRNVDNNIVNIEKGYYLTWLLDGDITKKQFTPIEKGIVLKKEAIKKYLIDVEYSDGTLCNSPKTNQKIRKIIFYKDLKWFEMFTEDNYYPSSYYMYNNIPFYYTASLKYYEKKVWNEISSFGGMRSSNGPDYWQGVAYYNLKIKNELLKIKMNCELVEGCEVEELRLKVSENNNVNYLILTDGYTLYLIK
ncbi:MAG: hypothetical protein JKY08_10220 [Flavobacteriaceae bacterium]|nr:hypothetical protein [Flavobacteriaceae bacterium]